MTDGVGTAVKKEAPTAAAPSSLPDAASFETQIAEQSLSAGVPDPMSGAIIFSNSEGAPVGMWPDPMPALAAMQTTSGTLQILGGTALATAGGPAGMAIGLATAVIGVDNAASGVATLATGEHQPTIKHQLVRAGMEAAGLEGDAATTAAVFAEVGIEGGLGLAAGLARAGSTAAPSLPLRPRGWWKTGQLPSANVQTVDLAAEARRFVALEGPKELAAGREALGLRFFATLEERFGKEVFAGSEGALLTRQVSTAFDEALIDVPFSSTVGQAHANGGAINVVRLEKELFEHAKDALENPRLLEPWFRERSDAIVVPSFGGMMWPASGYPDSGAASPLEQLAAGGTSANMAAQEPRDGLKAAENSHGPHGTDLPSFFTNEEVARHVETAVDRELSILLRQTSWPGRQLPPDLFNHLTTRVINQLMPGEAKADRVKLALQAHRYVAFLLRGGHSPAFQGALFDRIRTKQLGHLDNLSRSESRRLGERMNQQLGSILSGVHAVPGNISTERYLTSVEIGNIVSRATTRASAKVHFDLNVALLDMEELAAEQSDGFSFYYSFEKALFPRILEEVQEQGFDMSRQWDTFENHAEWQAYRISAYILEQGQRFPFLENVLRMATINAASRSSLSDDELLYAQGKVGSRIDLVDRYVERTMALVDAQDFFWKALGGRRADEDAMRDLGRSIWHLHQVEADADGATKANAVVQYALTEARLPYKRRWAGDAIRSVALKEDREDFAARFASRFFDRTPRN